MKKHFNLFLIITMILGTSYFVIFQYDSSRILTYLAIIPILIFPFLLKKTKFKLKTQELFYYLLFVFFADFLGCIANLYNLTSWYDTAIHFFSGVFSFEVGMFLINRMQLENQNFFFFMLFGLCFVMLIASVWEFFEFGADIFLNMNLQHQLDTGVTDTMIDMISAFIGGICTVILHGIKEKSRDKKCLK